MEHNELLDSFRESQTKVCNNVGELSVIVNDFNSALNIIHVNIRGVKTNFDDFLLLLSSLDVVFDVIIMSETHIVENPLDFNINTYSVFYNDSSINWCDGTIVYVKSNLVLQNQVICINNYKFLRLEIMKNLTKIGIVAHYRLPSLNESIYHEILLQLFTQGHFSLCPIEIFAGDTNINILDEARESVANYLTCLSSLGYFPLIDIATRNNSCLDHFFHKGHNECNSAVLNNDLTDHFPIVMSIKLNIYKPQSDQRFFEKLDASLLSNLFKNESWQDVLLENNADRIAEKLTHKLKMYIQSSTKEVRITNKYKCIKPWITPGLVRCIRQRNCLKREATRANNEPDALRAYTVYRDSLTKAVRKAKLNYYRSKINQNLKDPKKIWQTIQEASNEFHSQNTIKIIKTDNGQPVSTSMEIANEFNTFFGTIGAKLAREIHPTPQTYHTLCNRSMYLRPIREPELIAVIGTLKNTNSCGEDKINSKVIKDNHKHLIKPLLHLINCIFSTGHYPQIFKKSIIIPIHKGGDKTDMNNYRPISLCSVLNKIVEKCIKEKLWNYLQDNKLISPQQFGFRPEVGTDNALYEVSQFISDSINNNLKPVAIFLDLKKAFDTVAHPILLKRLESFGIRGVVNNLFKSFLSNRVQAVKIDNLLSDLREVEVGVPQGTVLGPILFSIYVNSLLNIKTSGKIVCFADDTAVLVAEKSWQESFRRAELDLHIIKSWLDANQLTLNTNKTKFVSFSMTKRGMSNKEYIILHNSDCSLSQPCNCNAKIVSCSSIKYLGVYFDCFLKWDVHIGYVSRKIRKLVYKFSQIRYILPLKLTKMVYFALAESILDYGILCWGSACKYVLVPLKLAHKYILKVLLFKPKMYPTDLLFENSEFLNVRQLYCVRIIQFSLKFNIFKDTVSHGIHTRAVARSDLCTTLQSFSFTQRNINFTGPRLLNILPYCLKNRYLSKINKSKIKAWVKQSFDLIINKLVWFDLN